jgi:antitoxin VapB
MAISIKHLEADRLARQLAALTGLSLTDAILKALREQLERETGRSRVSGLGDDLRAISDRCAALPVLDPRSPEEIMGFDEHGLPR